VFIIGLFFFICNMCIVFSMVLYVCCVSNMCSEYLQLGLLCRIACICSLYLVLKFLPVCLTYFNGHSLHFV
jgi:hypothetical protein